MFDILLNESPLLITGHTAQHTRKLFPLGLCDIAEIKEHKFSCNTKIYKG
jgi:hypothetical protein